MSVESPNDIILIDILKKIPILLPSSSLLSELLIDVLGSVERFEPGEIKASIILLDLHQNLFDGLSLRLFLCWRCGALCSSF
jgi:hypothetical protein